MKTNLEVQHDKSFRYGFPLELSWTLLYKGTGNAKLLTMRSLKEGKFSEWDHFLAANEGIGIKFF